MLVEGKSGAAVGARYHVGVRSVNRHRMAHLSPALTAIHQRREESRAGSLVDRLEGLIQKIESLVETAHQEGSRRARAALRPRPVVEAATEESRHGGARDRWNSPCRLAEASPRATSTSTPGGTTTGRISSLSARRYCKGPPAVDRSRTSTAFDPKEIDHSAGTWAIGSAHARELRELMVYDDGITT